MKPIKAHAVLEKVKQDQCGANVFLSRLDFQPLVDVQSFGYARNPWPVQPCEPTSMNHHQQERKLESLVTKETKKSLG